MFGDGPHTSSTENEAMQPQKEAGEERICIKCKGRIVFLALHEIQWIEAAGNYLKLHTGSETYTVRDTMAEIGARLDPERFLRIHRSVIVNVQYIRELKPWYTGEYVLTLTNGKELTLSRKYRSSVDRMTAKGGCAKRAGMGDILVLEAKKECEKCNISLAHDQAFACIHECTFCDKCAAAMRHVCPNCGGRLSPRQH
jgi:hypothetical protein